MKWEALGRGFHVFSKTVMVNGHIFANSDQVGGSTSFMTPTNPIFSIWLAICIEALWVRFADLLQTDLDKVKESCNNHWIRKSRNATVSSILDMMYFLPEEFGQNDCLIPVSSDKLIDMEIYILTKIKLTQVLPSMFNASKKTDLTCPRTILEEGTLYEKPTTLAIHSFSILTSLPHILSSCYRGKWFSGMCCIIMPSDWLSYY